MPCYAPSVTRQARVRSYRRRAGDPLTRPLHIYTFDSATPRIEGAMATIDVPWEPLAPGPSGALFVVDPTDGEVKNAAVDLEDPRLLIQGGLSPSISDHRFHQQMVYAVASRVYAQFQAALGRLIAWGFDDSEGTNRLTLRPHAPDLGANAAYDKDRGRISFGYFAGPPDGAGRCGPNGRVFTCLSHDVIAHEVTHALLDGLRAHFDVPTSGDVLGFHEGFADLITVFQHFTHRDVLEAQIRRNGVNVGQVGLLTNIAEQFGLTTRGRALRCAISPELVPYRSDMEPHDMGSVLLSAVFAAFADVFERKSDRYVRLAYDSSPTGYVRPELASLLAEKAESLARQFLNLCIRAIDYCPPIDVHLGEYLRALITADRELVPDDRWSYRDSIIAGFAQRAIYPEGVDQLSEDALVWRPPTRFMEPIRALHFSNLRFAGDPSLPASETELIRQAEALWDFVTRPHVIEEFGLSAAGVDGAEPCVVQSIRTARRVGPDGQVLFDLVAEITQERDVHGSDNGGVGAKFFGGCTLIIGPEGEVRYSISKNIRSRARLARQLAYQRDSGLWRVDHGTYAMTQYAHMLAHQRGSHGEVEKRDATTTNSAT